MRTLLPFNEEVREKSKAIRPFEKPDFDPLERIPCMEIPLSPCPLDI
jgi:hypothetical protein